MLDKVISGQSLGEKPKVTLSCCADKAGTPSHPFEKNTFFIDIRPCPQELLQLRKLRSVRRQDAAVSVWFVLAPVAEDIASLRRAPAKLMHEKTVQAVLDEGPWLFEFQRRQENYNLVPNYVRDIS